MLASVGRKTESAFTFTYINMKKLGSVRSMLALAGSEHRAGGDWGSGRCFTGHFHGAWFQNHDCITYFKVKFEK